jgi:hypothetical protein
MMKLKGKQGFADASFSLLNRTKRVVRKVIRDCAKDVIEGTPFDTGRLKNNWYASNRQVPTQTTRARDKSGKKSLARVDKALTQLKIGQTFYMANSLPYSRKIEYGGYPNPSRARNPKTINGFSKQAPSGMLRIAVASAIAKLRR